MRWDSTGLKVEIAFGCLIALLIGVSWLGLSRMGQINAGLNEIPEAFTVRGFEVYRGTLVQRLVVNSAQ